MSENQEVDESQIISEITEVLINLCIKYGKKHKAFLEQALFTALKAVRNEPVEFIP